MLVDGLVSVIVPVYNVRSYLVEALDSVLGQTWRCLEVIVVDDGSTDGSGDLCDEYAARDPRVRVLHQENAGLSAARNAGLNVVTGDMIAFLDSDDAYCPGFLAEMVAAMGREHADLVVCRYAYYKTTGRMGSITASSPGPAIPSGTYDRAGAMRALVASAAGHVVWNKLYARRLFDDVRYPEGHVYEDTGTICRILDRCDTVCVLDQKLCLRRMRPGSITATSSEASARDLLRAYGHVGDFVAEHTPEVFEAEHLTAVRRMQLGQMVGAYMRHLRTEGEGGPAFWEGFRGQTVALGREVGIGHLGRKAGVAYLMMRFSPQLLGVGYRAYLHRRRDA